MASTMLVVGLAGPPVAYAAAAGPITTSAQALDVNIGLLSLLNVPLVTTEVAWTTGGPSATSQNAPTNLNVLGAQVLSNGAVTATAQSAPGGGRAEASVAGLGVLGTAISLDAIATSCAFTASGITATPTVANLKIAGQSLVNPGANTAIGVPGVLSGTVNEQTATYSTGTGRLSYTMRGLDVGLLNGGGLSGVANGTIVVAESKCSGIVRLGAVSTTPASIIPGNTGTPTVTVTNTGDIAAPNTVIKIPAPPAGYTVGTATTNGGGTCATGGGFVTCTGVTVPGQGSVVVSLPVTIASSAVAATNWTAGAGTITAVSTPITGVPDTTITVSGAGSLVTRAAPATTSGSVTVYPMNVAAGKNNTTSVTVANDGPSDALAATATIPFSTPAGVSIVSATVPGGTCTVGASAISCTGFGVPAGASTAINVKAAATVTTPVGTVLNLTNAQATLNGTTFTGSGRLLTVSDPDVNIDNGVTITGRTAVPGGPSVTPTVKVANVGIIAAGGTTIAVPAPPAGYTVGSVSTTGGGTCTTGGTITCTGVTIPAMGTVTMSIPVTLNPAVTADWTATATATATGSTGTATGTFITASPQWTLGVTSTGPAPGTVLPGHTATMTVNVTDQGPSNAVNAPFQVIAPTGTTFGALTSPCTLASPTVAQCSVTIATTDPATVVTLPLNIPANADPSIVITGGCVDRNNNGVCDPGEPALPGLQLRTPLADRLTAGTSAVTVVPGTAGDGLLQLTSTQAETGLTVTVALASLPAGFTVPSATGPCTLGGGNLTCTGIDLTAGTRRDLPVHVSVASSVNPPQTWTASGISVSDGVETITAGGDLAIAGTPTSTLTATVLGPADNTVEPGDLTSLRVTAGNSGPSDATGATFTVSAPADTTFQPLTGAAATLCTLANNLVTCTVTLAVGASTPALDLPLLVDPNVSPFTALAGGCIELDHNPGCGSADVTESPIVLKVPFAQQITVATTQAGPVPGATDTATVKVTATHGAQNGLTVTVPLSGLPAGVTVTAAGPGCTIGGGNVACTGLNVANGATATITLTVTAGPAVAAGTTWTATGISVGNGTDPAVTLGAQLAVVAQPGYTLQTTVTPPAGPIEPGGTGSLTVSVDNTGPSDATGAHLGFLAPTGATFQPLASPTADVCTLVNGGRVSCAFDLTAAAIPLQWDLPFEVGANVDPSTPLPGGCVDRDDNGVCDPGEPALPPVALRTPLSQRLTVTTGPDTVIPGNTGTGLVKLTSTRAETGLTVTVPLAQLPTGFTVTTATSPCAVGGGNLTCTGVDLTAGTERDLPVRVSVASDVLPPLTWTATGITISDGTDTVTVNGALATAGNPQTGVTATVTGPPDNTVQPGDTTHLYVVARNAGPSDAPATVFTVNAPTGTTFDTLTGTTATSCTVQPGDTAVQCTVSLPTGASTPQLDLPLLVPNNADPAQPLIDGCVELNGTPGCGPGDVAVDPIYLKTPFGQQVSISTVAAHPVPGADDTATVRVNAIHGALSGLTVTVPFTALPAGLTVTGVGPGCVKNTGDVTCTGVSAPSGGSGSVTFTVAALSNATAATTWTESALSVSNGVDPAFTDSGTLAVVAAPAYTVQTTVTAPASPLPPGGTGSITATVDNIGPSDATNATLSVIAPNGVTFLLPAAPCALAGSGRVTCPFSLTEAGTPLQFTLPIQVAANADPANPPTGGCVDRNNNGVCDSGEPALPPVPMRSLLGQRLTVGSTSAQIVPGTGGAGVLKLTSTRAETGLTVTVPLTQLPTGFTVTTATSPCTLGGGDVTCTGIDLSANTELDLSFPVAVAANVVPPQTWTATGITISDGTDTATVDETLAAAANPQTGVTATITGPADDTVAPGSSTTLTVVAHNAGPSDAPGTTFSVTAPTGTTFGPLAAPAATSCTLAAGNAVAQCTVNLATGTSTPQLLLPLDIPAGADPFTPVGGSCVDLDGTTGCGANDVALAAFRLKVPFDRLASISTTSAGPAPGTADTATVGIRALHGDLSNLTVDIPLAQRPAGLSVTGMTGPATCRRVSGQIECTGLNVADGDTAFITLRIAAGSGAVPGTTWTATGISVSNGADPAVSADGQLAQVGPASYTLQTTFTPPADPIEPGGTGTLGVTVDDLGPADATGVTIGVLAPAGATFLAPDAPCTLAGPTRVTCTFGLPAAAAPVQFALPIQVAPGADPGTPLPGFCADLNNNVICDSGEPTSAPIPLATPFNQQVSVTTTPVTITPGQSGTASVVLTTDRQQSGLTLDLPLAGRPGGFTTGTATVLTTGSCTADATAIHCTGIDLPAAGAATISVPVTVGSGVPANTTWNSATITVTDADGRTATGTGTLVTTSPATSGLTAAVTGPAAGTVLPGGTATFTTTISNGGPSDATGAPITVQAPVGTTFTTAPAGCSIQSATTLACTVTLAAAGTPIVWTLAAQVPAGAGPATTLTGGCLYLNGSSTCVPLPDVTLATPLGTALTVTSDDPAITPGTTATATVRIASSDARTGLTVDLATGTLPAGLTLAGASCPVSNGVVHCTGVAVTAGGSTTITLDLSAAPGAAAAAWTPAITVSQGGETVNRSVETATVGAPVHPLAVAVQGPAAGTVYPGGTGTLAVTVTNAGPSSYPGARANFFAPNGTTFAALGAPATTYCGKVSDTEVDCTFNLAVEAQNFTLDVLVPATAGGGTTTSGGCADLNLDSACGAAPDQPFPGFTLGTLLTQEITVGTATGTVTPGLTGSGRVQVTSDRSLTGLTVTVPRAGLPAGFTITGASGPAGSTCTQTGDIVCTGVNLVSGVNDAVTVTFAAAPTMATGVTWTTPGITVANSRNETVPGAGDLITTGAPITAVSYAVTSPTTTVTAGGTIALNLRVRNTGPSTATPVHASVVAPAQTTFGTLPTATAAVCARANDTRLDCTFTLDPAADDTYAIPLLVSATADPDVTITGGCVDADSDTSCGGSTDIGLPATPLVRTLAQTLTLTADNASITPGTSGTATVRIATRDTRAGLTVTVPTTGLPAGMTITGGTWNGAACTTGGGVLTCGVSTGASAPADIALTVAVAATATSGPVWTPSFTVSQGAESVSRSAATATVGAPSSTLTVTVTAPAAGTVLPGGTADLAVRVHDNGPSTARSAVLLFRAPAGTAFLAPAAAYCTLTSSILITCTSDVLTTADLTFALRVSVPATAEGGTTVGGGCYDGNADSACGGAPDTGIPAFTLGYPLAQQATLSVTPATITPGLTGTVLIKATTTAALTGLSLTVPLAGLPAGITLQSASGGCTAGATQVVCTGLALPAGTSTAATLLFKAAANLPAGVTYSSTGITLARGTESVRADATLLTTGTPATGVTFVVAGPAGTVQPGATTAMTVTVGNTGPSDATGRTASIIAPTNTTFGTLSGAAAGDCTASGSTLLTCTFSLAAGATPLVWTIPFVVDADITADDTVSDGCVSSNGDTDCADTVDVDMPDFSVGRPLSDIGTITLTPVVIAQGATGTAVVTASATGEFDSLTMTVSLSALPAGFTVTDADVDTGSCTVANAVICTGMTVDADTTDAVRLSVKVAASASATAKWSPDVRLVDGDATDSTTGQLTATGLLVSTKAVTYAVTVTVGSPSPAGPAAGQTTVVPITLSNAGPGKADPYAVNVVVPAGMTHGTLPSACVEAGSASVLTCTVSIAAGANTVINLPLVVDSGTAVGTTFTGGCVSPGGDTDCADADDLALPDITTVAPSVDLSIDYANPTPKATPGGTIQLILPYSNNGSTSASDVQFSIDPPAGVTVVAAQVLLDASTAAVTAAGVGTAQDSQLLDAECVPDPAGDENAVICTGPDAPIGTNSQLYLSLKVAKGAKAGKFPVSVTISTTSAEGNVVNNVATAQLTIAGSSSTPATTPTYYPPNDNSNYTGGPLPRTGQNLMGLLTLSVMLVGAGVAARVAARDRTRRRRA